MFFETQIHSLSFISNFFKCVLRLKSSLGCQPQRVDLSLKRTFQKVGYETQGVYLSLKEHFKTCDINLTHCIWTTAFETQMTFSAMSSEPQILHLRLKWPFQKRHLKSTSFKMLSVTQVLDLNLKLHYSKYCLRLKKYLIYFLFNTAALHLHFLS